MLAEAGRPLVELHDLFMLDLDGVVYIGGAPVPGVARHLARIREQGGHVAFLTNNASRTPAAVADRLVGMGIEAATEDVVTSAQAAASLLRDRFGAGASVLALGGEGLHVALREAGLTVVSDPGQPGLAALATGYGPDVLWRDIMRAAVAVRDGLPWVASNTDATIPTEYGLAPGHGVLVRTLSDFAGVQPRVAGKPATALFAETLDRVDGRAPLMVGDRLDTDILGANEAGLPSLLVLTGVSGLSDVLQAPRNLRPTYIAATLEGAFSTHGLPRREDGSHLLGGWAGRVEPSGGLVVEGAGSPDDWWRVAASAAWAHLDETGESVASEGLRPPEDPVGEDR